MQQQRLDFETPTIDMARAMGKIGEERAQAHAERVSPGFTMRAMAFVLEHLKGVDVASGEDLTDACKQAGIVPDKDGDRAFGAVYGALSRRGAIEMAGFCERRKGHGTAGGRLWRLKRPAVRLPEYVFDKQRETCAACKHCYQPESKEGARLMSCMLDKSDCPPNMKKWAACSAARAKGGVCGPDASRFERA